MISWSVLNEVLRMANVHAVSLLDKPHALNSTQMLHACAYEAMPCYKYVALWWSYSICDKTFCYKYYVHWFKLEKVRPLILIYLFYSPFSPL